MNKYWRAVEPDAKAGWHALSSYILQNKIKPTEALTCPSCGNIQVRFIFARYDEEGKGGFWIWCRCCHRYEHSSCKVSGEWSGMPPVSIEKLEHSPEWLDTHLEVLLKLHNR